VRPRTAPAASAGGRTRPGYLLTWLAVRGASGRLACFEYPAAPSRDLLLWLVDHPGELTWPSDAAHSAETERLRRALIDDHPSGVRARAQERARERARTASPFASDWWRFETASLLDCVLITDELVITVEGRRTEPPGPAAPWYPQRSRLVRDIEAAGQIAQGRAWGSMLISDEPLSAAQPRPSRLRCRRAPRTWHPMSASSSRAPTWATSPGVRPARRSAIPTSCCPERSAQPADARSPGG